MLLPLVTLFFLVQYLLLPTRIKILLSRPAPTKITIPLIPSLRLVLLSQDVQLPEVNLSVTVGSGAVSSITAPTYRNMFQASGVGFTNAPEVIISPSDGGGDTATATASINADGKVTGFTITGGGTAYTTAPDVTIVGGPHFARVADETSQYYGRCFLITNNSRTNLTLDMSNLADGESTNVSTYFPDGTSVEVIPAATLGTIFGAYYAPTNWGSATSWRGTTGNTVDWCMFMILHLVVTRSMSTLQEVTYTGGILETKDMVLNVIIPWFIQMKRLLLPAEARTQLP